MRLIQALKRIKILETCNKPTSNVKETSELGKRHGSVELEISSSARDFRLNLELVFQDLPLSYSWLKMSIGEWGNDRWWSWTDEFRRTEVENFLKDLDIAVLK